MEDLYLTQMVPIGSNPLSLSSDHDDIVQSRRCLLIDYQIVNNGKYDVVSFDSIDHGLVIAVAIWERIAPIIFHPRIIPLPNIGLEERLPQGLIQDFESRIEGTFVFEDQFRARPNMSLHDWLKVLLKLSPSARGGDLFKLSNYQIRVEDNGSSFRSI